MDTLRHILIVEDESSISDSVAYALRTEGFTPICCETGGSALEQLQTKEPLLIILDVGLPDISGFELCRTIRKTRTTPILFLTARAEEVDRILGLELGGDDYVSKPFSPREVVSRVKAILRRLDSERDGRKQRRSKNFTIDEERMRILFFGEPLDLSRYEFRLLAILIRRPGRVYSREKLMNLAWESPEMSLERTVDTHIKTIRAKLRAVHPERELIITHRGVGYSLSEDE